VVPGRSPHERARAGTEANGHPKRNPQRASLTPATDADKGASLKQAALAWDTKDADPDDASQRAVTDGDDDDDDDEEALEDEVTLASDPDHTPAHDPARQPAIDDDEHELTLASDREGTHADPAQQPAIDDDDEEHSLDDDEHEALADTSDGEHAPTADALMQTAKAEIGADATADDQPAPQLATPVPLAADEGFSFAMFAKQGTVQVEVAKEVMPAGQVSPQDPGSGMPADDSALPDEASQDVGNAAPSKEPVVHHGDLAP
jgi:hypothetical protein